MLNIKSLQSYKNTSKKTMLKERILFTSFQLGLAETLTFISCFFPGSSSFSGFFPVFQCLDFGKTEKPVFQKKTRYFPVYQKTALA
jgi:hypothetical protein